MAEHGEPETNISPDSPHILHGIKILGARMTYVDTQPTGSGSTKPVALFLHGNPTSSFLWRNVIPHVSPSMRCVAPDLVGMGGSSKPANLKYRFTDHYTYLSAFIETVIPSNPLLLVVYDWGSALGMHWAYQQAESSAPGSPPRVVGIALMEFLRPFLSWEDFSENEHVRDVFKAYRSPETGRRLLIEENAFVEKTLPGGVVRNLTDIELDVYRRPFLRPDDRIPTLAWPNQIPIDQKPADVFDIATRYHYWLMQTDVPKLLLWASPGTFITRDRAQWYSNNLRNVTTVHLGKGLHFLPEDHPRKIGQSIRDWVISSI